MESPNTNLIVLPNAPQIVVPGGSSLDEQLDEGTAIWNTAMRHMHEIVELSFRTDAADTNQTKGPHGRTEAEAKRRRGIVADWFAELASMDPPWSLRRIFSALPQILRDVLDGRDPQIDLSDDGMFASRPPIKRR